MSKQVRHVLGISGGKDSAALAIYMKDNYPELDIEYYTTDTGEELQETYDLIDRLEIYLGKPILRLEYGKDVQNHQFSAFELLYLSKRRYLPSSQNRWCTQYLKLKPFEDFIGNDPVISYVGLRGDEDREGYISKKIQSVYPFQKNIWGVRVTDYMLSTSNYSRLIDIARELDISDSPDFKEILEQPISLRFSTRHKLKLLLNQDTKLFNKMTFQFMKGFPPSENNAGKTEYPLALINDYPLINDESNLVKEDIFSILRNSGVGVPKYYEEIEFEVDGQIGKYARSRSGCYFCFFQQKIEWVWLYEQHPDLYRKAMEFERGYTWNDKESLAELVQPERILQIKRDFLQKQRKAEQSREDNSPLLMYKLQDLVDEEEGCAACFI